MLYLKHDEMNKIFVTKVKSAFPEPTPEFKTMEWPTNFELERKPIKHLKSLRIAGISWYQKVGAIFSLRFQLSDGSLSPQFGS